MTFFEILKTLDIVKHKKSLDEIKEEVELEKVYALRDGSLIIIYDDKKAVLTDAGERLLNVVKWATAYPQYKFTTFIQSINMLCRKVKNFQLVKLDYNEVKQAYQQTITYKQDIESRFEKLKKHYEKADDKVNELGELCVLIGDMYHLYRKKLELWQGKEDFDFVKRLEDEVIERMRKRGFETEHDFIAILDRTL